MDKSIYSENYRQFLELLRQTRKKAGVTQEELAERLNETQSFVSKCERGERRLDLIEVRAFCKAIGIPFRDFVAQLEKQLT